MPCLDVPTIRSKSEREPASRGTTSKKCVCRCELLVFAGKMDSQNSYLIKAAVQTGIKTTAWEGSEVCIPSIPESFLCTAIELC